MIAGTIAGIPAPVFPFPRCPPWCMSPSQMKSSPANFLLVQDIVLYHLIGPKFWVTDKFSHHWRPSHPLAVHVWKAVPWSHAHENRNETDGSSTTWEGIKKQRSTNLSIDVRCYRRRPMRLILAGDATWGPRNDQNEDHLAIMQRWQIEGVKDTFRLGGSARTGYQQVRKIKVVLSWS